MHFTLHLTDRCNLRCRYCYTTHGESTMTLETAKSACDLAVRSADGGTVGIVFFGGEPLMCCPLIYETVKYAETVARRADVKVYFKITTNGILLDEEFVDFANDHRMFIALSHDGVREANDGGRVFGDGSGTFDLLEPKIDLLLSKLPYSPVLMTVTPQSVPYFAQGVEYLYSRGFRYIVTSLDYSGDWDDASLSELKRQYRRLAVFYNEHTLKEDKFYLSAFEVKLRSHILGDGYKHERCELGKKQLSVAPDGRIYPCTQFVGHDEFVIGDVVNGVDESKRRAMYDLNEGDRPECEGCMIKHRCNRNCGCVNLQTTGRVDGVSPILCEHERMLVPIVDRLAEALYRKKNAMFLQKNYNDMFAVVSLVEDKFNSEFGIKMIGDKI